MRKPYRYGDKKASRIVGILYITGTVAGILSVPFLNIRNAPDDLIAIANNPNSLVIGAVLELIMGFTLAMIPAFMFPILKRYNEVLGVGYIIFRGALETCTYIIQAACYLALSSLGLAYATAGIQNLDQFLVIGTMLNAIIELPLGMFAFGMGALLFYSALYLYRLIPRWISGFGIIAVLLHMAAGMFVLFGLQENFDKGSLLMNLPIAVQEMVMAVWLIIKGFRIAEIDPASKAFL